MESKEKKFRQYRSNQGRSPEKTEANYKVIGYSFLLLIAVTIVVSAYELFF